MKVAILAGGFGTRLSEETSIRPKPMVEVGGRPMLWHIMKMYARHGLTDFVVLGGYKVEFIKQYFMSYSMSQSDFTIDLGTGDIVWKRTQAEPWRITVLDTGDDTMTGGRIRRARDFLGGQTFCLTYGDGVSDVDIGKLVAYHRQHGKKATVTAVTPPGRFGVLRIEDDNSVGSFKEKHTADVGRINGGFFVLEPSVLDLIDGDATVFENDPMDRLVMASQLVAYKHDGYWQNMDTLRDRMVLEKAYADGAPWLR
jgi:glucose-1-phosphate cytidylyltransferase